MKKLKEQKEQHPILNQVLTPEFLKQFKDSGELNSFMEQLYARAMEQMLEGEMDSHLGYEKHSAEGVNSGNSRNGKASKRVKTTLVEPCCKLHRGYLTIAVTSVLHTVHR